MGGSAVQAHQLFVPSQSVNWSQSADHFLIGPNTLAWCVLFNSVCHSY